MMAADNNSTTLFDQHRSDLIPLTEDEMAAEMESFQKTNFGGSSEMLFTENGSALLWDVQLRDPEDLLELPLIDINPYNPSHEKKLHEYFATGHCNSVLLKFTELGKASKHIYSPPCNWRQLDTENFYSWRDKGKKPPLLNSLFGDELEHGFSYLTPLVKVF